MNTKQAIYILLQKFGKLGETYKRENYSQSVSLSAGEAKTVTFSGVTMDGCRSVGIIEIAKTGGGSGYAIPSGYVVSPSANTATITLYNRHTAAVNITVEIGVLFVVL